MGLAVLTRTADEDRAVRRLADERGWWLTTTLSPRAPAVRLRDLLFSRATGQPHLLVASRERRFLDAVRHAVEEFRPDVVQAEQIAAAPYLSVPREAHLPTVYSAHNVESRVLAGPPETPPGFARRLSVERMRRVEEAEASRADTVVAVSGVETDWFQRRARRVVCVPNAVDLDNYRFRPASQRPDPHILFTGHLGYPPNRDAALILVREIYPCLARKMPAVRCRIAGSRPRREIRLLDRVEGVEVVADFATFEALERRSGVFVCPLRWGAGSRLKLLEAAAVGLPIVATPFSAEGLCLEPGRDYVASADPRRMASDIAEVLRNQGRRETMSSAARAAIERHHTWTGLRETIANLYESLRGDSGQG